MASLRAPEAEVQRFVLPIGCNTLWSAPGHRGGPSPLELETAIQTVEDQIEGLHHPGFDAVHPDA